MKKKIDQLIEILAVRMVEIDANISCSMYNLSTVYATTPNDIHDRTPDGDDYNLLWDTIVEECNNLRPGVLEAKLREYRKEH